MLPGGEELADHLLDFSRVKLERAPSGPNVEAGPASTTEVAKFAEGGRSANLHRHAAGAFHLRL